MEYALSSDISQILKVAAEYEGRVSQSVALDHQLLDSLPLLYTKQKITKKQGTAIKILPVDVKCF